MTIEDKPVNIMATNQTTGISVNLSTGEVNAGTVQFRNRIINGDMRIDQRNCGTSITVGVGQTNTNSTYIIDRWQLGLTPTTAGYFTASKVDDAPTNTSYQSSLKITSTSAVTTTSFTILQAIEGYHIQDFQWGTTKGKPITVSFWVKCSIAGNYTLHILSSGPHYSYNTLYTVISPNTWEFKIVTIPPPPSVGTTYFKTDNSFGIYLQYRFAGNATSTLGWQSGVAQSLSSATTWHTTTGASWQVTGVQVEIGLLATPFEFRSFITESLLCQRYYSKSYEYGVKPGTLGTTNSEAYKGPLLSQVLGGSDIKWDIRFKVTMRGMPTLRAWGPRNGVLGGADRGYADNSFSATMYTTHLSNFVMIGSEGAGLYGIASSTAQAYLYLHYEADADTL
jgi:hypothetical protein